MIWTKTLNLKVVFVAILFLLLGYHVEGVNATRNHLTKINIDDLKVTRQNARGSTSYVLTYANISIPYEFVSINTLYADIVENMKKAPSKQSPAFLVKDGDSVVKAVVFTPVLFKLAEPRNTPAIFDLECALRSGGGICLFPTQEYTVLWGTKKSGVIYSTKGFMTPKEAKEPCALPDSLPSETFSNDMLSYVFSVDVESLSCNAVDVRGASAFFIIIDIPQETSSKMTDNAANTPEEADNDSSETPKTSRIDFMPYFVLAGLLLLLSIIYLTIKKKMR